MARLYCTQVEAKATNQLYELWSWGRGAEYALAPLLTNNCCGTKLCTHIHPLGENDFCIQTPVVRAATPLRRALLVDDNDMDTCACRGALGNSFTEDVGSAHRTTYQWKCSGKPSVHAGMWHSGAVVDGEVHMWGQGKGGRLGLGDEASRLTPTPVPISSGAHTKVVLLRST